jgi:hypothetical protein
VDKRCIDLLHLHNTPPGRARDEDYPATFRRRIKFMIFC